jgi:DNA phosphorothioation-dependent restriction protein DptG
MSTSRRLKVTEILEWMKDPALLKRKVKAKNTILFTGEAIKDLSTIERVFNDQNVRFKKYPDEGSICLMIIEDNNLMAVDFNVPYIRDNYIETKIRGWENLVQQYKDGVIYKNQKQDFLSYLDSQFESEYMSLLKEILSVIDKSLLEKFEKQFIEIRNRAGSI